MDNFSIPEILGLDATNSQITGLENSAWIPGLQSLGVMKRKITAKSGV